MLARRLPAFAALSCLALALFQPSAEAAGPKVLLVAASSSSPPDVQAKLKATGAFSAVDIFDASSAAPTLTQLKAYDAVAVWSYIDFFDATQTGDNLAAYVEQGGGVVIFDYETQDVMGFGATELQGKYQSTYTLMTPQPDANISLKEVTLGMVTGHPITAGVNSFHCGNTAAFVDCHHLSSAVQHGGQVVAKFSDGTPLAVVGTVNGHTVVDLNFFPASDSLSGEGEWDHTTDGAILMKNALLYVLAGSVRADKGAIDFGTTGLMTPTAPQTITYKNTSMMAQTVNSVTVGGTNPGDFEVQLSTQLPVTLTPGGSFTAKVDFNPQDVGMRSGILSAQIQGQMGTLDVSLTGNSVGPIVSVAPTTMPIDLGGVPLGQTAMGSFTVKNTGGGVLNVTSLAVTTDAASFTLMPSQPAPFSLAPNASVTVAVSFSSTTPGRHMGTVTIKSQLPDKLVQLTAGTGAPMATLGNFAVAFGPQHVGVASPPATLTVKNSGYSDLVVSSINLSGANAADFSITAKLPLTIHAGGTGAYQLSFKPSVVADEKATVTLTTNDPSMNMASYGVSGSGYAFMESLSTMTLDFGTVKGGMAPTKDVVVQNTSGAPLHITDLSITGAQASQFSLPAMPSTPIEIAANDAVPLTVQYKPTVAGMAAAALTITVDDPNAPMMVVTLKGTATAGKLMFSPAMVDFGSTVVGVPTMQQAITLSNTGSDTLTLSTLSIGGANSADYISSDLPPAPVMIAAGMSVTFHLVYEPQNAGSSKGEIDIVSDDPSMGMATIPLTGVGAQPMMVVNPLDIDFGVIPVSASSMDKMVTVQNTGNADLVISSVSASDAQFVVDRPNGFTVKAGQSVTFNVHFTPSMAGAASGTISINPQSVVLMPGTVNVTGNGSSAMVTVAPTMLTWPTVTVGKMGDAQTVTLTNKSGAPITIGSITSTSQVFPLTAPATPLMLADGATTTFTVAFKPAIDGMVNEQVLIALAGGTKPVATVKLNGQGLLVTPKPSGGCSVARTPASDYAGLALLGLALCGLTLRRRRK